MTIAVAPSRRRSRTAQGPESFLRALGQAGVSYAVLRGWPSTHAPGARANGRGGPGTTLEILVDPADAVALDEVARSHGLDADASRSRGARHYTSKAWSARVRSELRYGESTAWLGTGETEERVLHRARSVDGVRVAAAADRLVDEVLHCLLDLGAFPGQNRRSLTETVGRLRADPPAAGRAAERVQQELAPALPWSDLLADILHERWDALLARRGRLRIRLWRRAPLATARRYLSGRLGVHARSAPTRARPDADRDPARPLGKAGETDAAGTGEEAPAEDHGGARADGGAGGVEGNGVGSPGHEQIRGSSLLLGGRGLSVGLKFLAELLIVRYLTTNDYGAWTYALSAVVFLRGFATLGLHRAIARFVPIHLERGERHRLFGVMAFVFGSLFLTGTAVVTTFYAFPDFVAGLAGASPDQPIELLFIVIFLVPIDAMDDFLTALCAAFTDSRTIFVRRYLLSPGLRIGVALLLVLLQADVRVLAYGYLLSGLAGIGYYAVSVFNEIRRKGLLDGSLASDLKLPVREVLSYTVPVMAADWCSILMSTAGPLLLGYFSDMSAVALFQVVVPLVTLTKVVQQSFGVLYEPEASRLFARDDRVELERFYWRSAVWVAVLTFPAFALAFVAADPLTVLLYGERYAEAAPILSILALGMFFDSVLGFNTPTIRVAGALRWLVGANVTAAAVNVVLNILLIPSMGALGAAIATGCAWIFYGILKQAALRFATGVSAFDLEYAGPYVAIAATTGGLIAVRVLAPESMTVPVAAAVVASLVVLATARRSLSITRTFPELGRVPMLRKLLG